MRNMIPGLIGQACKSKSHASRKRSAEILKVGVQLVSLVLALLWSTDRTFAQSYLTQVGDTPFQSVMPIELGYYDASTGVVHVEVPLGTWPQRGKYSFRASLVYDSRIWYAAGGAWQPTNITVTNWSGWRLQTSPAIGGTVSHNSSTTNCGDPDFPRHTYTTYSNFKWTDPYGTIRTFPIYTLRDPYLCNGGSSDSDTEWANDSSGYVMTVTNYTTVSSIVAPDGTQVYPGFKDSNGNYFSKDSNGNIIDTLGRTPVKVTTNCNGYSSQVCYDVLNSQGTTSRYTLNTTLFYVSTAFGQPQVTEYSGYITVVSNIQLPDGTHYSFSYDGGSSGTYGELTGMTLPTGGSVSYSYTTFFDMFGWANRWLQTRTSGGGQWTYTPSTLSTCYTGYSYCQQVVVTKPSGDQVQYHFDTNLGNYGSWADSITYYQGSWPQIAYVSTKWSSGPNNVQKLSVTTEPLDAPSPYPVKSVQYTYVSTLSPLIKTISEWSYYPLGSQPSTPDRVTTISSYCNASPLSVTVTNGAGTQIIAQTNYAYDAYGSNGLVSVTGTSNHDDTGFGSGYTSRCNPTSVSQRVDSGGFVNLATSMTYDTTGQVRSVTDQAGNTTNLSYADSFYNDGSSNPPSTYTAPAPSNAYLTQVTLPRSGSISYGYYYGTGQKALTKDQNGATSYSHFYDSMSRPTETISPINGWVLWQYPASIETQVDKYTGVQDTVPSSSCSSCRHDRTTLDGLARTIAAVILSDPDGNTTTATTYDTNGRISTTSNPYRSSSDPTYGLETYTYDGLSRSTKTTHADGNTLNTFFGSAAGSNGGRSSQLCSSSTYGLAYPMLVVDEAGKKRQSWVDGFSRTIEVDEPDSSGNLNINMCYGYDLNNNLTSVAPQGAVNRTYSYDLLSRMTQRTDPETGTVNYYTQTSSGALCSGNASALCRRVDARGIIATYSYDAENRLIGTSYSDATPAVSFYYDQSSYNGLTIANGKGRRTGMSDGSGQTAWSFDAAGNVVTKRQTISGVTNSISTSRNPDNSVASVIYPSGRVIAYAYNNAARPTSAVDSANGINYATQATYVAVGTPASVLHGNTASFGGIAESYTYNNRLQMTGIVATSSNGTAFSIASSYTQTGGNNGSLASVTNNLDSGRNLTLGYDYLNRISSAQTQATSGSDCWGLTFGDDAVANLLSETVSKCSAYPLNVSVNSKNQISNSGFTYDASGNLTGDGTYTYSYNAENELTSAAGITYTYDGDGLRVKKTGGTLYWRSLSGQALAETDLSGNLVNEYIFFAGRRIAQRNNSGSVYYYFVDQIGSTRVITDSHGNKCYDTDYYPYGTEAGPFTNSCGQNYKYTGFELDSETGLYYAFARYYNPRIGRFMSADRRLGGVGNPQSLNRYAYALNNPSTLTDGSGLYPQDRHLYITYLLAVLAGYPDGLAQWTAQQTAAQDDFMNSTTGLFGIGAIVNFSGHFGVPCNQGGGTCSLVEALLTNQNVGAQLHLIEDNSPGGPHNIIPSYWLGARIANEILHILLPIVGKNPDTDSGRLGGWLGAWVYLTGSKDGFPEDLISEAVTFVNQNDLTIVGLQVTLNGQTSSMGQQPSDDAEIVWEGDVDGIHLVIYQEPGGGGQAPSLSGTSIYLLYMINPSNYEYEYGLAQYLCSIGRGPCGPDF